MPVAKVLEEEFIEYITKPIVHLISESDRDITSFKKKLRKISFKIRGESRRDLDDILKNNPAQSIPYFDDMSGKVKRVLKDLFEERANGVYYIYHGANLFLNQKDVIFALYANSIYEYCLEIETIFQKRIHEINESSISVRDSYAHAPKCKVKKTRVAKRQSYELTNPDINLQLVHKILRDNKFIDKGTSFENFSQAFSGDPVSPKIIWFNANSLQYFIQSLIKGKGVKSPNQGKWNCAIKCFKNSTADYTISNLQNTIAPVGSKTRILDLAIKEINKK